MLEIASLHVFIKGRRRFFCSCRVVALENALKWKTAAEREEVDEGSGCLGSWADATKVIASFLTRQGPCTLFSHSSCYTLRIDLPPQSRPPNASRPSNSTPIHSYTLERRYSATTTRRLAKQHAANSPNRQYAAEERCKEGRGAFVG